MKIKFIILFILIMFGFGCVYYNTFYNAEKWFKEAQEIELSNEGRPTSTAIQKYNKVIKKCGIVLDYYEGSKYSDDALLLMAKSFFYIGRNYTQTISTLEDMIKFYPDSEHVPEAFLYTARANYEFGQTEEAYKLLHDFLLNKDFKDHHAEALSILANYKLRERDYVQTDYYLNKLIEDFPDSDEYEKAFFLQGKSQYEAEQYDKSNEIFFKLLKSRVTRKTKFDARYYIAMNYLLLEEYKNASDYSKKLLKDEYRDSKISRIRLVEARSLAELGKIDDAISLLEAITEDNKRTSLSAAAFYFLGEISFHKLNDYTTAIEYYNKVKNEDRNSEYLENSILQSAIASQIIQYYNPDSKISTEELINQQFKLAEFYIEYLNMPDSALIVYNSIIEQENRFETTLDSMQLKLDSLAVMINSKVETDSLMQETKSDSLMQETKSDSMETDNSEITKINIQAEYDSQKLLIENTQENMLLYQIEFVPFAKFAKLWLYKEVLIDSAKIESIYNELKSEYPDNKYTYAADQFLAGQDSIIITTRKHIGETTQYNAAIRQFETRPEEAIESLLPITEDVDNEYRNKAFYSLGYINYFILSDSLAAKPYLDSVLTNKKYPAYSNEVEKFYDGDKFIKIDRLPYIEQMIQNQLNKEKAEQEEQENTDKELEETEKEKEQKDLLDNKPGKSESKSPDKGNSNEQKE
ncbi:MAG: tetratricopeptide repeat protein [Candidatus Tenebribacter davisii]|nr:tetratricopeptide repeat protein [Candidatus Tenebribacter davisii]